MIIMRLVISDAERNFELFSLLLNTAVDVAEDTFLNFGLIVITSTAFQLRITVVQLVHDLKY